MSPAVGSAFARSDGQAKVQGTADYGVDVSLPGMVHAKLLRSPVPSGRIRSLDVAEAVSAPGILAVLTGSDVPNEPTGMAVCDQPLLASEQVRYVGEPVVAVVGESEEAVISALSRVKLEIEPEPAVTDLEAALEPDSPLVHPEWESYHTAAEWPRHRNVVCEMLLDPDGIDEVFATADHVVSDVYRVDRQYQAYLEPKAAVAEYRAGRFIIHVSHQFPFNVRDRVAQTLGVEPSAVRVVGHHIGGGFGAKLDLGLEAYAAVLARAVGRPVRMANTRSEDLVTAPCRENAVVRIRSAVSRDGQILARDMDVVFDSGAYAIDAPYLASLPIFAAGSVYRVAKARVRCRAVYTNTAPTGAFRGVSGAYLVFAVERHTDHIAATLGEDRLRYRRSNLLRTGDALLNGQVLADADILSEAFDRLESSADWSRLGKGKYRGVGVASCVWLTNPLPGSAVLKLNEDGTLGLVTGATDNGSGAVTMGLRQIAAEELSLAPDKVLITMPDTDVAGYDAGSQGSRTTRVVGRAVRTAGAEVREKAIAVAAELLEADAGDIELLDGELGVRGVPTSRMSLAQVAQVASSRGGPLAGTGSYTTPLPAYDKTCASGLLFPVFPTPTYHVHLAEVEVDPVTGNITVSRYVVIQEVGKVINPVGVAGQIQGGVTQGLGYALWEWLQMSDGSYRQQTFETYGLPLAVDVPRVEIVTLEHGDPEGPFGAKGVAEPPVVPVAAAIANAVSDAVGRPMDRIPITPEDVLVALGDGERE